MVHLESEVAELSKATFSDLTHIEDCLCHIIAHLAQKVAHGDSVEEESTAGTYTASSFDRHLLHGEEAIGE